MTEPLVPFREFVLKVHSRCDLACDHCYVYEHADQSWTSRPKVISEEVMTWTVFRLAEHAKTHASPAMSVILHGGEPLLAGPARLRRICEQLRTELGAITTLDLRIHTNAVQLTEQYLEVFAEHEVRIGVSLDGDKASNDRHRRYADGRSSHAQVIKAIGLLRQERYRHLYAGLLCTIDVTNDPVAVYDALVELDPPRIDFLLPHATWDDPPPRPDGSATAYADWLLAVHERWEAGGRPLPVRLFDSVLSTLGGGPSLTESMGLGPTDLVVIETDGTLEQADSLKTAFDGAPVTGYDVVNHSFDEAARHPGVTARQHGRDGLAEECGACPVVASCGGGLYAHRYREGSGFDNPSVYCTDLETLVRTIDRRTVPAAVPSPAEIGEARSEVTRSLLAGLHEALGGRGGYLWDRAWETAVDLDADAGPGARDGFDRVLAHPYTRTWVARCLRGETDRAGHLANLTAAAVVRAGLARSVRVPVVEGWVALPTLGRVWAGDLGAEVEIVGGGPGITLRSGVREARVDLGDATPGRRWEPLRELAPGLLLDDTDPCRDCHDRPPEPRLTDARAERFRVVLGEARALLREAAPDRAAELEAGTGVLTPLLPGPWGPAGKRGFGALGVVPGQDPAALALSLVEGFQYARLDALLDLCDLYDEADTGPHRIPWRDGPGSLEELLAGACARSATAEVWRGTRHGEAAGRAARDSSWSEAALDTLAASGALTPLGKRFVSGMRAAVSGEA